MVERSRFWDGTSPGDAAEAPYDAPTEFAKVMASISGTAKYSNGGGVCRGELNELAVSGTASPLSVASGRAIVNGTWYENDAATTVVVPTPSGATRIDRIVLRKSWSSQTVRITRIAGVEGGGAPTLTQSLGVTWDIPLAQASITTGGVITVTDQREMVTSTQPTYQVFSASGTWTKPLGCTLVFVEAWGAGGGGGGGEGGAAASDRAGGSGGGGGAYTAAIFRSDAVGATEVVTVGAGGPGGAGGSSANGVAGTAGGNTSFGSLLTAYGGGAGAGGQGSNTSGGAGGGTASAGSAGTSGTSDGGKPRWGSTAPTGGDVMGSGGAFGQQGGAGGNAEHGGGAGGGGSSSGGAGQAGGSSLQGGASGGAGGGVTSANAENVGGAGGNKNAYTAGGGGTAGAVNGVAGGNGSDGTTTGGSGGGGGGGQDSGTGGGGGTGGNPGGGGGGGGAGTTTGGVGGTGGRGEVRVWTI